MPCDFPSPTERPNIILVLADDMGFSDIGCFGSEIRTPHLDVLAHRGIRFTQGYNCARCCPTRASLLTGLYPHQAGVGLMIRDLGVGPAYQGYLRSDVVTIAEVLQSNGYRTCYSGKWHVSPGIPLVGDTSAELGTERSPTPLSRGFDRFYGTLAGCANYFHPHALVDQHTRVSVVAEGDHYTDTISDRACSMIGESVASVQPFFLHVCYTAPHWPLHAPPQDIETYRGCYLPGWDAVRTSRHESLKGLAILNPRWDISARDARSRDVRDDAPSRQAWEDLRMAVYAAQVEIMDCGIGRILAQLRDLRVEDNTLILFLSDNGGCAEFLDEDGDGRSWPSWYRHTARPGEICRVGNIESIEPGPGTTFMSYDLPWANVSNTPFRLYKHWVHEGGIATPMIAHWPAVIRKAASNHEVLHLIDLMATCLDAADVDYPREYHGRPVQPIEGESFLPLLRGQAWQRERPIFWEHEGNRAVRDGKWKLVSKHPGPRELYDMVEDRTESHDLSHRNRPRVESLSKAYRGWSE